MRYKIQRMIHELIRKLYFATLPYMRYSEATSELSRDILVWLEKYWKDSYTYFYLRPDRNTFEASAEEYEEDSEWAKKTLREGFQALIDEEVPEGLMTAAYVEKNPQAKKELEKWDRERHEKIEAALKLFSEVYTNLWD